MSFILGKPLEIMDAITEHKQNDTEGILSPSGIESPSFESESPSKGPQDWPSINSNVPDQDIIALRMAWGPNRPFCIIYSKSNRRFELARIVKIWRKEQTNKEWFLVDYNGRKKEVQRFCPHIIPLEMAITLYYQYPDKFAAISFHDMIDLLAAQKSELKKEYGESESELAQIVKESKELQGNLALLKDAHQILKKDHQQLKNNHNDLKNNYNALENKHEDLKNNHEDLKEMYDELVSKYFAIFSYSPRASIPNEDANNI